MKYLKILFLMMGVLCYQQSGSHGLKMSRMHLAPKANNYELSLQFDLSDLVQTLHAECPEFEPQTKANWPDFFSTYIYDHVNISANGVPVYFEVSLSTMDEHFVHFKGTTNHIDEPVENISVSNNCMLSLLDDYSNVVSIQTQNELRSFRLSKDRPNTKINL